MSAIEPFSLYPPNIVSVSNREVVGVVTKCDHWAANPELAAEWPVSYTHLDVYKRQVQSRYAYFRFPRSLPITQKKLIKNLRKMVS